MILVILEHRDGKIQHPSLEALGEAKRFASQLNKETGVILLGWQIDTIIKDINRYGIDKIFVLEDETLKDYTACGYADAVLKLLSTARNFQPWTILLSATSQGKDLAPRVSAKLDAALIQDCIKIEKDNDNRLIFTRPVYAGKLVAKVVALSKNSIITLRPKIFEAATPGDYKDAAIIKDDVTIGAIKTTVKGLITDTKKKLDVSEADIIVSGGRGMKEPKNFALLEEMADVLGGAVGASRAAVDAGWRPHPDQVGQTGKVVTPKLYIACGISGAIQHLVGMSSSKCIVAINKDPNAPIFKKADYGIVGDLFEVVPLLIEELKPSI